MKDQGQRKPVSVGYQQNRKHINRHHPLNNLQRLDGRVGCKSALGLIAMPKI